MTAPRSGWRSLGLSVALHGLLVAAIAVGYLKFHTSKPVEQRLAIEATVVGPQTTIRSAPEPAPRPEPLPEPVPVPEPKLEPELKPQPMPPAPDPAIAQQAARDAQQRKEKAEAGVAEERRLAQQAEVAQRQAAADAERKKSEADKAARVKAEQDKLVQLKAAQALERSRREAELNAQIAAEERIATARSSTQMAQYVAQITARIERAWLRPATAKAGLECEVRVTQVPGGAVVGVQVTRCNGDESVRQSIEAAVYRASPLPQPSDVVLFERNLVVTFRPQD
jgi:colicin import membrane protein